MHARWVITAAMLLTGALLADEPNLVGNGDLEQGRDGQPAGWSNVDDLTVTWVDGGNPGRCLLFNPSVTQAAKKANAKGEPIDGPTEREQGKPGQYTTVGAHEGVWLFPTPIELHPDDDYFIIEVDMKGPVSSRIMHPQVFLRGFQIVTDKQADKHSSYFHQPFEGGPAFSEQFGPQQSFRPSQAGDRLQVWRKGLFCRLVKADTWQHFRMGVKLPKTPRYRPDVMLLKPYAMWPLGKYYIDNLVFRRCTKEEYTAAVREGHSAGD